MPGNECVWLERYHPMVSLATVAYEPFPAKWIVTGATRGARNAFPVIITMFTN